MIYLTRHRKVFGFVLFVFLISLGESPAEATKIPIDLAQQLKKHGYPSDTQEQIIEAATKAESYYVRFVALELLTQRVGKESIPTLRNALNDAEFEVRWRAAHLLGMLGDKSGGERMSQDLKEFAPDEGAPAPSELNTLDPNEIKKHESKKNLRLYNATVAARVLAELGDRRGYRLSVLMALAGPWKLQQYEAIRCLVEMSKTDKKILQAEGLDPITVLCAVGASQKDIDILRILAGYVVAELETDVSSLILTIAKDSPNKSKETRDMLKSFLDTVEIKKKKVGGK